MAKKQQKEKELKPLPEGMFTVGRGYQKAVDADADIANMDKPFIIANTNNEGMPDFNKNGVDKTVDKKTGEVSQDFLGYDGNTLVKNKGEWRQRLLVGTPMTGQVRVEWMLARYGQVIPTNWSSADVMESISTFGPLEYLVADAQNLIVKSFIDGGYEWLLLLEHDNVLPPGAFLLLNHYMITKEVPYISGLYFTKSRPPEPMVYRGKGVGYYANWTIGDRVWVSGVPTGTTLIHGSLIKALWNESPDYEVNGRPTRRVFNEPARIWYDPQRGGFMSHVGTSDLDICNRIIEEKIFEKAGWPEFQKMKFPFLVDTNLFIRHIDPNGVMYPFQIPNMFLPKKTRKPFEKTFSV